MHVWYYSSCQCSCMCVYMFFSGAEEWLSVPSTGVEIINQSINQSNELLQDSFWNGGATYYIALVSYSYTDMPVGV